jgi:hypothetical protein
MRPGSTRKRHSGNLERFRIIAQSFAGVVELDHFGRSSFRVNEKIFATVWDENHVNIMLAPVRIVEMVHDNPKVCKEFYWGRQLRCLSVDLRLASGKLLSDLLGEAWDRKRKKPRRDMEAERA